MTPERLAEIRERMAAATPGHWGTYYDHQGTYAIEAQPRLVPGHGTVTDGVVATVREESGDGVEAFSDAMFIAHARQDVPDLLAYVERLEAALVDAQGRLADAGDRS